MHYIEKSRLSQVTSQANGSHDCRQPKPIDLKLMLSKLPISLTANVNNLAIHVAVDRRAKYVHMLMYMR